MQIVPQILSYRYKNERSVAIKIRQNLFSAGALPRTPQGELTTLHRPLIRLERGHPSPYLTPLGTDPPLALAMRPPQKSSQIYTYDQSLYLMFVSETSVTFTIQQMVAILLGRVSRRLFSRYPLSESILYPQRTKKDAFFVTAKCRIRRNIA